MFLFLDTHFVCISRQIFNKLRTVSNNYFNSQHSRFLNLNELQIWKILNSYNLKTKQILKINSKNKTVELSVEKINLEKIYNFEQNSQIFKERN